MALGRICPEKGFHIALDAARRAGVPLLLAGQTFPYEAHETYFAREIAPRLDRSRRFIGPIGLVRKRRLLSAGALPAGPVAGAGDQLARGDGGARLRHAGGRVPGRRAAGDRRARQDRVHRAATSEEMAAAIHAPRASSPRCAGRRRGSASPLERTVERYFALYRDLARRGWPRPSCRRATEPPIAAHA